MFRTFYAGWSFYANFLYYIPRYNVFTYFLHPNANPSLIIFSSLDVLVVATGKTIPRKQPIYYPLDPFLDSI